MAGQRRIVAAKAVLRQAQSKLSDSGAEAACAEDDSSSSGRPTDLMWAPVCRGRNALPIRGRLL